MQRDVERDARRGRRGDLELSDELHRLAEVAIGVGRPQTGVNFHLTPEYRARNRDTER